MQLPAGKPTCKRAALRESCAQVFEAVPANSFDGIKGLFYNPAILSVPFGKKVSELPNRSGITWPYSPESAKEVLNTLWLKAGGSFDG